MVAAEKKKNKTNDTKNEKKNKFHITGSTPITAGPTPTTTKLLIDGVKQQLNATMN